MFMNIYFDDLDKGILFLDNSPRVSLKKKMLTHYKQSLALILLPHYHSIHHLEPK